jgi:hypothetical protein
MQGQTTDWAPAGSLHKTTHADEEMWKTAEILILRHQLAVLQRRQPRRPKLNWADWALLATLLGVIPKARRQGLQTCGHLHIKQDRMFMAVRDTTADATWLRGHIPAEGRLLKPIAEPEISMTAAHAPGDHHHSPGGTRQR